ncbi:MAG: DUF1028 domain-containing protein [Rhodospirillaceae bacterium]
MTFSIAAVDPKTGDAGVAVASKFLAVGNLVPWVEAGVGAVATQALCNARYGSEGLRILGGTTAGEALGRLISADPGRDRRQVGMVDIKGNAAGHTGPGCIGWAGHKTGVNYAAQGNCLAGEAVVAAMAQAFENTNGPLYRRLFAALVAGDAAGGDKRGRQSAALKVLRTNAGYQGLSDTVIDLRVDDAADPMSEMRRLIDLHELYFFTGDCPRLTLEGQVLETLRAVLRKAGRADQFPPGWSDELGRAIDNFIGCENLEERFDLKTRAIDQRALDHLVTQYL